MRKLTGSQRKAKKKQRTLNRRPKQRKAYVTLYHGSYRNEGPSIRRHGLMADNYSTSKSVYPILTATKSYANKFAYSKPTFSSNPPQFKKNNNRTRKRRAPINSYVSTNGHIVYHSSKVLRSSLIKVKLPKKVMHRYTVKAPPYTFVAEGGSYGIRKRIPSKYIK